MSPARASAEPLVRRVEAVTHGRYLLRPAIDGGAAPLIVGFHGFAESAAASLAALLRLPGIERWHVAAVEALHPFYTRRGEIVASWMTSQDREQAIADNIAYVRRAIAAARGELEGAAPLVLAGFSQGTAMAYRAAGGAADDCEAVLALAGDVPADLEELPRPSRFRVLVGRGLGDEWYDEAKMNADLERLERLGHEVETCVFDGGHEWHADYRAAAGRWLAELAKKAA